MLAFCKYPGKLLRPLDRDLPLEDILSWVKRRKFSRQIERWCAIPLALRPRDKLAHLFCQLRTTANMPDRFFTSADLFHEPRQ